MAASVSPSQHNQQENRTRLGKAPHEDILVVKGHVQITTAVGHHHTHQVTAFQSDGTMGDREHSNGPDDAVGVKAPLPVALGPSEAWECPRPPETHETPAHEPHLRVSGGPDADQPTWRGLHCLVRP